MFLIFTLLILAFGVWLFLNVFASFFPFLQNIATISDYNTAYYSALSSVERWSLVLRYKQAWFQGSWWTLAVTSWWPLSDQSPFFGSGSNQGNRWDIHSRTLTIPALWAGNVDRFLLAPDSLNYNAIRYDTQETILLSVDATVDSEKYYTWNNSIINYFTWGSLSWEFRLPPAVRSIFMVGGDPLLCTNVANPACDPDGNYLYDEVVLNWSLLGIAAVPFKIIPTINIFYYGNTPNKLVNYSFDNALRASVINDTWTIVMWDASHQFTLIDGGDFLTGHTVVSQDTGIQQEPFGTILWWWLYHDLQLAFDLVSLLRSTQWAIYPYLEYRFEFPQEISDRVYTLVWHGRNREYDVQIVIKKPTAEWTVGGDFTVIF